MGKLLGAIVGVAIAFAVIYGLWKLNLRIFPWPRLDINNASDFGAAVVAAPITAQAMLIGGSFLGALTGGLIAVRIGGGALPGWIVALLVAAAGGACAYFVPQPLWMQIGAVIAPLFAGLVVQGASGAA